MYRFTETKDDPDFREDTYHGNTDCCIDDYYPERRPPQNKTY